ncbi:MAG: hypothetical protein GYA55_07230 [SAR324 cluster bacterium]|uniref:Uncharacterized protein n=1 Tax=SAR324 cluster bacterium TaxID=2024889 RepID=A0A7X9FRE7_9DELT|nr:hypothetical protein [SAR324 cluster bacterium]
MTKEDKTQEFDNSEELLADKGTEEAVDDFEASWLDRMHSFLRWQIIAPKPSVPFGKSISDSVLKELIECKEVLIRLIKMRGMIEGDELVMVGGLDPKSPRSLTIETDNPSISSLSKADFHSYFERRGVYTWIFKELEETQKSYKEELIRRKKIAKSKKEKH